MIVPQGRTFQRLRVLNADGRNVKELVIHGEQMLTLALNGLSSGTYSIELVSNEGILRQWFVRQPRTDRIVAA